MVVCPLHRVEHVVQRASRSLASTFPPFLLMCSTADVAASGRVLTLRDTGSVARLAAALGGGTRRVVVVGNGGIAMQCM